MKIWMDRLNADPAPTGLMPLEKPVALILTSVCIKMVDVITRHNIASIRQEVTYVRNVMWVINHQVQVA